MFVVYEDLGGCGGGVLLGHWGPSEFGTAVETHILKYSVCLIQINIADTSVYLVTSLLSQIT